MIYCFDEKFPIVLLTICMIYLGTSISFTDEMIYFHKIHNNL